MWTPQFRGKKPHHQSSRFQCVGFSKFQAFAWNNCELIPKISSTYILCKILLDNGHIRILWGPFHSIKLGQDFCFQHTQTAFCIASSTFVQCRLLSDHLVEDSGNCPGVMIQRPLGSPPHITLGAHHVRLHLFQRPFPFFFICRVYGAGLAHHGIFCGVGF